MADVKISALPAAAGANLTDELPANQAGTTRKLTLTQVHALGLQLAGQLGGTLASPDVRGIRETAGPTLLTAGAIPDRSYLQRVGSALLAYRPDQLFDLWDEFLFGLASNGNIGSLGWGLGGGSASSASASAAHPGIINLSSSATINTIGRLVGFAGNTFVSDDIGYMACVIRPASGSTVMGVRFGFETNPGTLGEGSNGVYWSFLAATSANWRTITKDGAGTTANQTATAYTVGNWYFLEIVWNGTGWEFYLNGTLVFTHTTNISTLTVSPIIAIETTEAVAKTLDVDFARYRSRALAQRWT